MNQRIRQTLIHFIGWILFLSLPALFLPGPRHVENLFSDPRILSDGFRYFLMIGFFYLNYHILVPRFYFRQKRATFFLLVLACYLFIATVPGLLIAVGPPPDGFRMPPPEPQWDIWFRLSRHVLLYLLVFIFSLMMRIADRWQQAEKERKNTEVAYLKAQINPHFLFNTLNSIYSLALSKSDQTPAAIVRLSSMMRYVITEAAHDWVSLEKELEYLQNYLSLQQLRFGPNLQVLFQMQGSPAGKKIAPLLMITLVENAFKYGVSPEEPSVITIELDLEANELHLLVKNKKVALKSTENTGLGLENVRKRLDLLYPGKHILTVHDMPDSFSVSLLLIVT